MKEPERSARVDGLRELLDHLPSDEVLSEGWLGEMFWEDIFTLRDIVPRLRAELSAMPADARSPQEQQREALSILREIAAQDQPETRLVGDYGEHNDVHCRHCDGSFGDFMPWRHDDGCLWVRARALVEEMKEGEERHGD